MSDSLQRFQQWKKKQERGDGAGHSEVLNHVAQSN